MQRRKTSSPRGRADSGAQPERAKAALSSFGVTPSKAKGQNFLTQPAIADRIVDGAELEPGDEAVEIGPGLGILTERILARDIRSLVLIELDHALAERLRAVFGSDPRVSVIESDFLRTDFGSIVAGPAKIVGNLPFNAASAIFRKLCDCRELVALMVLMFQREVGERLRACPGDPQYSALSVFAALYFEIDPHFRVAAGSFHPKPRVDAEVLRFRPHAHLLFAPEEEGAVLKAVHASFSAPRKMLRNSLGHGLGISAAEAADHLVRAGIDPSARAESLSAEHFVRLARAMGAFGRPSPIRHF